MCGFIGTFAKPTKSIKPLAIKLALDQMQRRGPDGEGIWCENAVQFGHRRLAIQDLDVRSNQPMHSACGRYVIVFNGEIYNFQALRSELIAKGVQFYSTSDTEVLLNLFALEGTAMLQRLRGMFAFIIYDRSTRRALVARDAYGIKPLFYAQTQDGVLLASQVKALLASGLVGHSPSAIGQASFWLLGSVSEPHTWFQDIHALQAGHFAWVEDGCISCPQSWCDVADAWRTANIIKSPINKLYLNEVRERTHAALRDSVKAHLVADVPVGVFLSGGIDSGALAGMMVEAGAKNLQGITIAFDEFAGTQNDESLPASTLAKHYGIAHHVRRVTRSEFEADLPIILATMDQPSIDGVNTFYASKAVAELGLKVVVSGVGGDELFQGYSSFKQLPRLLAARRFISRMPGAMSIMRLTAEWQARRSGNSRWQYLPEWSQSVAGAWWLRRGVFAPSDLPSLMGNSLANLGLQGFSPESCINDMCGKLSIDTLLSLSQIESTTYMRNQLLRDSDWASMHHSVELRTPLIDAWLLKDLQPLLGAFSQFPNKRLLAEAPLKPLTEAFINRPKTGFSIPVQKWLRESSHTSVAHANHGSWARAVAQRYDEDVM
jgi:asparagine synthase (glutamine-hydrolysing)